uniref:Uncharacterized protein LOC104220504 n=1 Tax=Nicotiana sylvestris TaxID=4096 RepID=A0A1U7W5Z6_NICSY|nr:PREDICTED: uncharacterized protein LOC104220504 [Nicotiana sylvestris]
MPNRFLIRQLSDPKVSHIYREQNIVADGLEHLSTRNITFLADPPPFIIDHLLKDQQGNISKQRPSVAIGVHTQINKFCQPLDGPSSSNGCSSSSINITDVPMYYSIATSPFSSTTIITDVARHHTGGSPLPSTFCNTVNEQPLHVTHF